MEDRAMKALGALVNDPHHSAPMGDIMMKHARRMQVPGK
jgi:hypothetical protein